MLTIRISIQNPTDTAITKTKLLISPNRDILFQKADGLRGAPLPDGTYEFDLPSLAPHHTTSYIAYFEASKKITQDKEASLLFSIRNQDKILDSVLLPVLVKKCQQGNPAPYISIHLRNLTLDPSSGTRYLPLNKALEAEVSWQHMTAPFVLSVDWGDGEKEVQTALWSNKILLEHQYKTDSSFRVYLSLSDANGKSIQSELVIRVRKE